jgi:hypothetical protein
MLVFQKGHLTWDVGEIEKDGDMLKQVMHTA